MSVYEKLHTELSLAREKFRPGSIEYAAISLAMQHSGYNAARIEDEKHFARYSRKYRNWTIVLKRDFPALGCLIDGMPCKWGYIVRDEGGSHCLPGAVWFQTVKEAVRAIDVGIECTSKIEFLNSEIRSRTINAQQFFQMLRNDEDDSIKLLRQNARLNQKIDAVKAALDEDY